MKLIRVSLLLAALALTGCSSTMETVQGWMGKTESAVAPAKLVEFSPAAKFEVRWRSDVGDAGSSILQPAVTKDAIYGASAKGTVTRLERSTGRQVWRVDSGITVTGGVGAGEGLVVIGGNKGDVVAYDEDGKQRWKSKVSSEVYGAPRITEGIVIVRSGDGKIAGLNVADGKRAWLYERATMPALAVRGHGGVALQRGDAFAGFPGGVLVAVNVKDGLALWESTISQPRGNTELERISDITSTPVADDEQVCAIAFQGRMACVDIAQGLTLWDRDISSDKGLSLMLKYLYLSDTNGYVIALDKSSGSTIWRNEQLYMRNPGTPQAVGNFVVVGDQEGYLHALSREDGSFAARIQVGSSPIQADPVELDGGLLVQTRAGDVYSLTLR